MTIVTESFVDAFKKSKTGVSFYDDLLDHRESEYMKFYKGVVGHLEKMTADEYFKRVASEVFGCTVERAKKGLNQKNIDKYAQMMKDGVKFNLPYLNIHPYHGPSQEGRHRMLAMSQAFGEDAEGYVLIVEPYKPDDEEIRQYASKSSDPDWKVNYINQCLDKYLDRKKKEEPEEVKFDIVSAIDLDKGDVVDFGDGWCKIDIYDLSKSEIQISATLVDSGEDVEYSVDDFTKVKLRT